MRCDRIFISLLAAILTASIAHAETKPANATKSATETNPAGGTQSTDDKPLRTAFKIDPLSALNSAILQTDAAKPAASDAEMDLLQHARRNKMEQWSMAKAALLISGVTDDEERKKYLAQLADIAKECKDKTDEAHTPLAKAKILAKYLHDTPMHAGYASNQYNLRVLLDTGHYNCVSSAVLFNMMAKHCGIEVRAVTMSGHVFSRALDFDVEPTSGHVYANADRNDRILKELAAKGDQKNSPYVNQLFRETNNLGLLSTMYQDMGGDFRRGQHYEESVASYLKAACLDPKDPSTLANLRSTFKHWSASCKKNHDDSKAEAVDRFAAELLRDPSAPNKTTTL